MEKQPNKTWTKQELYQYAKKHEISVSKNMKKDEILSLLELSIDKKTAVQPKEQQKEITDQKKKEPISKEEDKEVKIVEKGEYSPKQKPEVNPAIMKKIQERNKTKKSFFRQEWFRYKRLKSNWRRPRGRHSKMRKNLKYRPPKVRIGYRNPTEIRGLHPSGFEDILVTNAAELEKINPKTQAARIAHSVGQKKREEIENIADKKGIRILNKRKK